MMFHITFLQSLGPKKYPVWTSESRSFATEGRRARGQTHQSFEAICLDTRPGFRAHLRAVMTLGASGEPPRRSTVTKDLFSSRGLRAEIRLLSQSLGRFPRSLSQPLGCGPERHRSQQSLSFFSVCPEAVYGSTGFGRLGSARSQ
jgi:hypothetical protein